MSEPRQRHIDRVGRRISYLEWGDGASDLVVLLHANGLCAGVFDPLARRLAAARRVVAVDLCGHGASDDPREESDLAFDSLAMDVVAVLDATGADSAALVGTSLGGGVGIEVALRSDGRIDRLMLCEAIAFPWMRGRADDANPMADGARRRRRRFTDRAEARARYEGRGPLGELAPECLDAYLRWGMIDEADGGVALACDPETEATLFTPTADRYGPADAFGRLGELTRLTPLTRILAGAETYLDLTWFEQQAAAAGVTFEIVDGGHFFVFADVARGVDLIESFVAVPRNGIENRS